jgi:hypothetical protein
LLFSPNIIRALKSRKMRWAGYVELMEKMRNECERLVNKFPRKRQLGTPSNMGGKHSMVLRKCSVKPDEKSY